MGKRARAEEGDADLRPPREEASVGQRTSSIKNKQRRSALYGELRHKAAVRNALDLRVTTRGG